MENAMIARGSNPTIEKGAVESRTDSLIKEDIEDQLRADTRVSNYDVDVTVENGVVTLMGEVSSYRAKNSAGDNAWTVRGVIDVINNLTVQYNTITEAVPEDVDIASNVKDSLVWDPDVEATDIKVFAENKTVTLEGTVDSLWKKHIAEDIAWNHTGVLDVKNKLVIVPKSDITDEAAARNIIDSVNRKMIADIDINDIDVKVENGKAVLNGSVGDTVDWESVYNSAYYTSGIKEIEDNLTIEEIDEVAAEKSALMDRKGRTDVTIKEDIENQLKADARILSNDVHVTVEDGTVTFTGDVPSYRAKIAASDNAWSVPGVKNVLNHLTVLYDEAVVEVPSDHEIKANIESSLSWDPDVDSREITVTVENGNVTLEGTVESLWKRYLAEDIAWNHIGIVDVKNKLAVASPENTTDKTAVSNIVESIDRNLHVDVDDVDVEVRNGEAIINGTVNSVEAWHAVYNAALFTSGVKKVEDNLLIA